jgi:hypothetical protein
MARQYKRMPFPGASHANAGTESQVKSKVKSKVMTQVVTALFPANNWLGLVRMVWLKVNLSMFKNRIWVWVFYKSGRIELKLDSGTQVPFAQ